jgi:AraC-like DNA-binding protein
MNSMPLTPEHPTVKRSNEEASWRKPLFADLLRGIRLRSTVYFRPEFRAPWGVTVADHGTVFHIIERGNCFLQFKGVASAVCLSAGDFVIVTRGDEHIVSDTPSRRAVDFFGFAKSCAPDRNGRFRAGGTGDVTRFVCGGMQFENGANPLFRVLPPLLHVKRNAEGSRSWLRLTTKHILSELDSGRAGAAEVVTRLADILLIQAVRAFFEDNADTAESGWLAAVRDRQIGQALALLHSIPHEPWTVASLAHRLAVSRSVFAARFTELVGEPPLRYLTRLRISVAADRLRSKDDKLSTIAAAAGYESVAAFAKSFKRHMGMTPSDYRHLREPDGPA